jgi:hypothetical protein
MTTPKTTSDMLYCCAGLLSISMLACTSARGQAVLYADNFDAGNSASGWSVASQAGDYTADFAFDYSSRGIPSAPNSIGGSTIGLRLTVNNNDAIAAKDAVSVYPLNLTLSGKRTLKFDLWLNYNGGAGGGSGSTEFATFGLLHSGAQACNPDNPASDGVWFAVSGEGGASEDYRTYNAATLQSAISGGYAAGSLNHTADFYQTLFASPPFETAGAPGKQWVQVSVTAGDDIVEWRMNGMLIAIRDQATLPSGNLMLGYMDTFTSIANPAADNFVIFDNVRVEGPDCDDNGIADDVELSGDPSKDCNGNGLLDTCESIPQGDFDRDGDSDHVDFEAYAATMAGPEKPLIVDSASCTAAYLAAFDHDADSDLALDDFAALQSRGTPGPFPPRSADAPTGRQFMAEAAGLTRTQREARITAEILGGNVPGFLREFVPINVSASISGSTVHATYYVSPDYLCIGHDDDFARIPMTPLIAQPIADALDCLLPTRKMVNDIYAQAGVKLAPQPISPATVDITLATTHLRHHELVESQRAGQPLGQLIGGIKKDVVITPLLASNPGKVAIYGWHQLSGSPIQPLYLGHVDWYVDYSHGIRLVHDQMLVDGSVMSVADVLADPDLHVLLSDEGVVTLPRY